jgi:hypothetical protein
MDELRREHLGSELPARSPSVRERLNEAYLAATNSSELPGSRPCPGRRRTPPELSHM